MLSIANIDYLQVIDCSAPQNNGALESTTYVRFGKFQSDLRIPVSEINQPVNIVNGIGTYVAKSLIISDTGIPGTDRINNLACLSQICETQRKTGLGLQLNQALIQT